MYTDYKQLYEPFVIPVSNAAPMTPGGLQIIVYWSTTPYILVGFLLLGSNGRIKCYHRLGQFAPWIRLVATPWNNKLFEMVNDTFHSTSTTILWE